MNKTEFLLALQNQINMLEDDEQKDIIVEYSQHLDMKVQNGMTEAEAIEEFGPLDQLVGEILGAYHVKAPAAGATAQPVPTPDPNAQDAKGSGKAHKIIDAEKVIEGGRKVAASAAEATKKGAGKLKDAAGNLADKTKDAASKAGSKTKDSTESAFAKARKGTSSMASGIAKGGRALGSGLTNAVIICVRWCWNIFVACVCAFFLFCALLCLFSLGFCLVLQLQGYPLLGICLCALGLLLASLSLMLLSAKLIRRKPQPAPADFAYGGYAPVQAPAANVPPNRDVAAGWAGPAPKEPFTPPSAKPTEPLSPSLAASPTEPLSPSPATKSTEPITPVR